MGRALAALGAVDRIARRARPQCLPAAGRFREEPLGPAQAMCEGSFYSLLLSPL